MRGYTQDKDAYLKRLRRIEGQVRGVSQAVEPGGPDAQEKVREAAEAISRLVKS